MALKWLVFALLLGIFCGHSEARILYENLAACQGERVKLHCGNATGLGLTIHSASYGRTYPGYVICPYRGDEDDADYDCGESDVTDTFKTLCARKNRCRVKVNSALFGDPCPGKHLYLILIYSCDWEKRKRKVVHTSTSSSIVTRATSTVPAPTSSLVSISSFSSITMFPSIEVIAPTSSVLMSQHTPHVKDPPPIRTTSTKDSEVDNVLDPFQEGEAGSATKHAAGSLGIAGTLFMWLLFMQDHSSDYITVFCASAAGALALAIIVGLFVLYRHHANKQHLQVKEESKLNPYVSTEPKMSAEVDPFLSGPIKAPPPDYMMDGYNWQRGETMPIKKFPNGTVVRTFSAKDVHTKEPKVERQTETPRYHRGPQFVAVARRQESSNMYLNPAYATNKSLRNGRGRHMHEEDRRGPRTRESGTSVDALYY